MEKNDREAMLEVKRRVRWGACVGDPERDWWGEVYDNISITVLECSTCPGDGVGRIIESWAVWNSKIRGQ